MLLVDPDECFRNAVAENLRDDGHQVYEFAAAEDVPPLATLGTIAVAMLEYSNARANRFALADAFHRAWPDAAVVLITAHWSDETVGDAASRPFLQVQSRPLDYGILHGLIHRSRTG